LRTQHFFKVKHLDFQGRSKSLKFEGTKTAPSEHSIISSKTP
jgi:hypothetical protein